MGKLQALNPRPAGFSIHQGELDSVRLSAADNRRCRCGETRRPHVQKARLFRVLDWPSGLRAVTGGRF